MVRLVGISGRLRQQSFNTALLKSAAALVPEGTALEIRTLHGIPLYNADDEAATGLPATVLALKEAVATADGVLLVTPEYNNSIPGVFKNAIDWLSRPGADRTYPFVGRAVALMGASPGGFGTTLSQVAWLPVLRNMGSNVWTGAKLLVPRAATVFDEHGTITDDRVREQLRAFLEGFAAFAAGR
jgi:chromate reductase